VEDLADKAYAIDDGGGASCGAQALVVGAVVRAAVGISSAWRKEGAWMRCGGHFMEVLMHVLWLASVDVAASAV
jgi:hypothetical protein